MDCQKLDEVLFDFVGGTLEAQRHAQVEAHLASCVRCTGELAAYRSTVKLLEVARHSELPDSFWARQRSRVMEAVARVVANRSWQAPPFYLSLLLGVVVAYVATSVDILGNSGAELVSSGTGGTPTVNTLTLVLVYLGLVALALFSFKERPGRIAASPQSQKP